MLNVTQPSNSKAFEYRFATTLSANAGGDISILNVDMICYPPSIPHATNATNASCIALMQGWVELGVGVPPNTTLQKNHKVFDLLPAAIAAAWRQSGMHFATADVNILRTFIVNETIVKAIYELCSSETADVDMLLPNGTVPSNFTDFSSALASSISVSSGFNISVLGFEPMTTPVVNASLLSVRTTVACAALVRGSLTFSISLPLNTTIQALIESSAYAAELQAAIATAWTHSGVQLEPAEVRILQVFALDQSSLKVIYELCKGDMAGLGSVTRWLE
jgi:hypothetical protein